MTEINTFVFYDIETTGLITCDFPKITELAFTACSREHLLNANKNEIPRAVHKLLLVFNPQKVIQPDSTRITGLDNFLLEYLNIMDSNTIDLINCFFNQLKKPVCLCAHNGNKFDYPILARQLKKLNRSIDKDLLCVDTLNIFKQCNANETNSAIDEFLDTDLVAVQNRNEKTPSKSSSFCVITRSPSEKPKSAKCLFESPITPSTSTASSVIAPTSSSKSSKRVSYKLIEIYKRLNGCVPKNAHNAEADTIHLLLCAIAVKNQFVALADSMAIKFDDIC